MAFALAFGLMFLLYIFGFPLIIIAWFLVEVGALRIARQMMKSLRPRKATVS